MMKLPIHGGAGDQEGAPQQSALTPELKERLDRIVQENDLVLFMKGTPEEPRCGFSHRAAEVYQATGRSFKALDVFQEEDPARFVQALAEWAEWPTLPQCWVKGELIGGSDIALEMFEHGDLEKMLSQ